MFTFLLKHFMGFLPYTLLFLFFFGLFGRYARLRHIPGPFLAKFSDFWRLVSVAQRRPQEVQLELHKQYGDLVRLGPNCVSVTGPDTIPSIYGIGKGFVKVRGPDPTPSRNSYCHSPTIMPPFKTLSMADELHH